MAQINKPTEYFNTKLYTGDGGTQSVTGMNFQPDFSWLKCRSTAYNHRLFDAVRGAGKNLQSNLTVEEATIDEGVVAFETDGFSVKEGVNIAYNRSGETYCSWNWLASNTTASNTDGSITSTVSANTTSGFSIVSYTGTGSAGTVGHGLGVTPACMILKDRTDGTVYWYMYHKSLGNNTELYLNTTDSAPASTGAWNTTSPTSSVFSVGSHGGVNASGDSMIAYCFAEKKGFSKFGSYTGNGSTDGTFIYTGFKPAFFITKASAGDTTNWNIYDNKRSTYNAVTKILETNTSNAEQTYSTIDFLSNGVKFRGSQYNSSGVTYITMAFAESPLVGTNNTPATAR